MIPIHPFVIHFIIALFPLSVLLDVVGAITRNDKIHFAAWLNLILSGISVILAVGSGLLEKNQLLIPLSASNHFELHQTLAFLSAAMIPTLVLWRLGYKGKWPQKYRRWYGFPFYHGHRCTLDRCLLRG